MKPSRTLQPLLACVLLLCTVMSNTASANTSAFIEGKDYVQLKETISRNPSDKVLVTGVFSYSCPHCASIEPVLENWSKTLPDYAQFTHVPAIFNRRWEFYAKVYYTIDTLGIKQEAHQAIFDSLHKEHKALDSDQKIAEFLAEQFSQDVDTVKKTMASFGVKTKIQLAKTFTKKAGVIFVPLVIVDGKYLTSVSHTRSEKKFLEVLDYLVKQARRERV